MFEKAHSIFREYNVSFAYLFGSVAKGNANTKSDIDIAVYLAEMDKFKRFEIRCLLMGKLSLLLKKEVEVIILNDIRNNFLLNDILFEGKLIFEDTPNQRFAFETSKQHQVIDYLNHLKYANNLATN